MMLLLQDGRRERRQPGSQTSLRGIDMGSWHDMRVGFWRYPAFQAYVRLQYYRREQGVLDRYITDRCNMSLPWRFS